MAGHFYDTEAKQYAEVLCKDGITVRDADARDAKKNNWGVGVTTVLSIPEKYHLKNWIIDQHLKASFEINKEIFAGHLNSASFKNVEDYLEVIKKTAKVFQERTSKKGREIHKALEDLYTGKTDLQQCELRSFAAPVIDDIDNRFGLGWTAEQMFYHPAGFGGTVDLHSKELGIIIDFKTKDKGKDDWGDVRLYDEHYMQLEAYRLGLQMPETTRMFIVFISQQAPGLHEIRELTVNRAGDFDRIKSQRAGKMFQALLHYWQYAHDMPIKDVKLYD